MKLQRKVRNEILEIMIILGNMFYPPQITQRMGQTATNFGVLTQIAFGSGFLGL